MHYDNLGIEHDSVGPIVLMSLVVPEALAGAVAAAQDRWVGAKIATMRERGAPPAHYEHMLAESYRRGLRGIKFHVYSDRQDDFLPPASHVVIEEPEASRVLHHVAEQHKAWWRTTKPGYVVTLALTIA